MKSGNLKSQKERGGKNMKKKRLYTKLCILTPIICMILSTYFNIERIPRSIFIRETGTIKTGYFLSLDDDKKLAAMDSMNNKENSKNVDVKFMGIFPVKSVNLKPVPEISVYPGGMCVGVKLNTKGVLIVALSDIETKGGKITSPSATSGIAIGDNLLSINGTNIESSEMLVSEINKNKEKEIEFVIDRKGEKLTKRVLPVKSDADSKYKIGLWVRDSTAGVGTLTFYDSKSKKFAALGHPVTDVDTGTILNIAKGEVVSSSIVSIRKGVRGNPGELKGIFMNEDVILGNITKNTECGIFGVANDKIMGNWNKKSNKPIKIALKNEINEGKAQIITTIDENGPKYYDIEIVKLLEQDSPGTKSMVIKVTDPVLLEKTGGIVQGMSGSPIIQNNKLIGAVTHVLINKPDTGYGIYIEWMLNDSEVLKD
jgi:stage IV sporulation protein B